MAKHSISLSEIKTTSEEDRVEARMGGLNKTVASRNDVIILSLSLGKAVRIKSLSLIQSIQNWTVLTEELLDGC